MGKFFILFLMLGLVSSCVIEAPQEQISAEEYFDQSQETFEEPYAKKDSIAPSISNPLPQGVLPSSTSSIGLQVSTNEKAFCKYDILNRNYAQMSSMLAPDTAGRTHRMTRATMQGQSYAYYVRCADEAGNESPISAQINFSISDPGSEDKTAPIISGLSPLGALPGGTTSANLFWTTNEPAQCRYSTDSNAAFAQMSVAVSSNGISHIGQAANLIDSMSYEYYVVCRDGSNNESASSKISFSVDQIVLDGKVLYANNCMACHGAVENSQVKNKTAQEIQNAINTNPFMVNVSALKSLSAAQVQAISVALKEVIPPDITAPVISNLLPTGALKSGTTSTPITFMTNEQSLCRYSNNQAAAYDTMMAATSTNGLSHSAQAVGLVDGQMYQYFIQCRDMAGNLSQKMSISFLIEEMVLNGSTLYASHCMNCHGDLANSTKRNKSSAQISSAISSVPLMNSAELKALSTQQIDAISMALKDMAPPPPPPPPADTTAPKLSSSNVANISLTSAQISASFDEDVVMTIEYGESAGYGAQTMPASVFANTHSVTISGLKAGTTYHYRVKATDKYSNMFTGPDQTFKTMEDPNNTPVITQVYLIDSSTDQPVKVLTSGDNEINLAEVGSQLNISAEANNAASIKFVSSINTRTESVAPFAFFGDSTGDYFDWSPAPGSYSIQITPYSQAGAGGTAGASYTVNLNVINKIDNNFSAFKAAVDKGCVSCHGSPSSPFGGLVSFYNKSEDYWANTYLVEPGDAEASLFYQRIRSSLTNFTFSGVSQNMPTNGGNGFNQADAAAIRDYINNLTPTNLDCSNIDTTPSKTEQRRLNKVELKYAIRDLFNTSSLAMESELDSLPREGDFDGMTTVGARQQTSKTFVMLYEQAVEKIVEANISKLATCGTSNSCRDTILFNTARRAWSKELTSADQTQLRNIVSALQSNSTYSFSFADAVGAGIKYILMSPQFMYVTHESAGKEGQIAAYNDYEIAKRLSLTLWKSVPDVKLLDVAKNEALGSSTVLTREAKRLIADAKFSRSRDNFVDEWLRLGRLDTVTPNPNIYGVSSSQFEQLKPLMKQEVKEFVKYVSDNDLPLNNLVNGKFTVVNKTLADHYGLSHPGGGFTKVNFSANSQRGGLSTLGGIISMNSNTNRRSIVLSGVWFLNSILCDDPPTPGDDVATEVAAALASSAPHRDLAEERASNQNCAGCHGAIDGAGLPFNTFDSVGKQTNSDEFGRSIASYGEIYMEEFNNTHEFLEVIKAQNKFKACMANKMMIYATGEMLHHKTEVADKCKAVKVSDTLSGAKDNFEELILGVIKSDNFLRRNVP